jgi:hypothetical protein
MYKYLHRRQVRIFYGFLNFSMTAALPPRATEFAFLMLRVQMKSGGQKLTRRRRSNAFRGHSVERGLSYNFFKDLRSDEVVILQGQRPYTYQSR